MSRSACLRNRSNRAGGCCPRLSRLVRHQRKKLADSEFRQWVDNNRLHVVITHKFSAGEVYEEHAQFRQQPELIQEKWSWKESKHGRSQREFAVDFLAGIASAHISQDHKDVSKRIEIEPGRTFAGFGFSLALSNLRKRLCVANKFSSRQSVFRISQRSARKL
jgi:hypothetical protein